MSKKKVVEWGQKKHGMPSLGDICCLTTSDKVIGYMVANELIVNRTGEICGKIDNYPGSSMKKPSCTGKLNVEGPNEGVMHWRCNRCRCRTPIFKGTVLDSFKIPLPDLFQILYLSMLYLPVRRLCDISGVNRVLYLLISLFLFYWQQNHIATMTRHTTNTVAKIQSIVLLVKGTDRMYWSEDKLMLGGFVQNEEEQPVTPTKKAASAARHVLREHQGTVIKTTEHPELLGQKLDKVQASHEGPTRWYNFQKEAYEKLSADAKKTVDSKSGLATAAVASSSGIRDASGSASGSASSSSSSSSSSVMMEAEGKDYDDPVIRSRGRGFDAFDEQEGDDVGELEEEAVMILSMLSKMISVDNSVQRGVSNAAAAAAAKDDNNDSRLKRPRESHGPYWISEYHADSKSEDTEGVDSNNYGMSVAYIDESLFGKQKYHKGNCTPYPLSYITQTLPLMTCNYPNFYFYRPPCERCVGGGCPRYERKTSSGSRGRPWDSSFDKIH